MLESFFIFIGGIQPRRVTVDPGPRRCPRCGLQTASLQRLDYYLSLFFIPFLRVKTGEEFLACSRCGDLPAASPAAASAEPEGSLCRFCRKSFPAGYLYCPLCGRRL